MLEENDISTYITLCISLFVNFSLSIAITYNTLHYTALHYTGIYQNATRPFRSKAAFDLNSERILLSGLYRIGLGLASSLSLSLLLVYFYIYDIRL